MLAEEHWQRRYYYAAWVEISVYLSYFRIVRLPTTLMLEVDGRVHVKSNFQALRNHVYQKNNPRQIGREREQHSNKDDVKYS